MRMEQKLAAANEQILQQERQAVIAAEQTRRFGRLGRDVFDRLRLVEDHGVELDLAQKRDVGPHRPVGRENEIGLGERLQAADP